MRTLCPHCHRQINGVDDIADVRVAELRKRPDVPPRHDIDRLKDISGIDILVVDGPSMPVHSQIRAPALPFFYERLNRNWLAAVDDAERPGEQVSLRDRRDTYPGAQIDFFFLQKAVALVRSTSGHDHG